MTAIKTDIGAQTQAEHAPFRPSSDIPASNTWDAIQYVKDVLDALAASLPGAYQPLNPDMTGVTALEARALAALALTRLRSLNSAVADAKGTASEARSQAALAITKIRKIDDVQIALKAQVFN